MAVSPPQAGQALRRGCEGGRELRLILLRVGADELDNLTVTVSGLFVVAARLVNHPQRVGRS